MLYVAVDDKGDAIERPISLGALRLRFPNVSIPDDPTGTFLAGLGIKKVGMQPNPPKLEGYYTVLGIPTTNEDGTMKRTFEQVPYTETALNRRKDILNNRAKTMIGLSDWSQTADVQSKMSEKQKNEWAEYRETLRNMVAENPDPEMAVFPQEPSSELKNYPTNDPVGKAKRVSSAMFADAQIEGYDYTFPDGTVGNIQTRDVRDLINILGLAARAMIAQQTGDDFEIEFRDRDDINHKLNSTQAMIMAMSVFSNISELYAKKWDIASRIEENPELDLDGAWNDKESNNS